MCYMFPHFLYNLLCNYVFLDKRCSYVFFQFPETQKVMANEGNLIRQTEIVNIKLESELTCLFYILSKAIKCIRLLQCKCLTSERLV